MGTQREAKPNTPQSWERTDAGVTSEQKHVRGDEQTHVEPGQIPPGSSAPSVSARLPRRAEPPRAAGFAHRKPTAGSGPRGDSAG